MTRKRRRKRSPDKSGRFHIPIAFLPAAAGLFVLTLGLCSAWAQKTETPKPPPPPTVEGRVIDDLNDNGKIDPGEKGIVDIEVTDGVTVVKTDGQGNYRFIRSRTARFVHVTVPSGWRARKFYQKLVEVKPDETTADTANFLLLRDSRKLDEDAPALVHIVDVRPPGMPDEVADGQFASVLQHVTRLRPVPHALVIAGGIKGYQARKRLIKSMAEALPPVHHVFVRTHDELTGRAPRDIFEAVFGPTCYSFEAGKLHCAVRAGLLEDDSPKDGSGKLTLFGRFVLGGSYPLATPTIHGTSLPGSYRVFWSDATSRIVYPLDEPLFRWVYPASGDAIASSRLRLLATAYDSTDVRKRPKRPGESWRLASLVGEPGVMKLAERDVGKRKLTGYVRRVLDKPGPFVRAGLHVCLTSGLPGLGKPVHTISFKVLDEVLIQSDLSTRWTGPGANEMHTGQASATVTPPLRLSGWSRAAGTPLLVFEGRFLLRGRELAESFRWAEPKRQSVGNAAATGFLSGPECGNPVMNDEVICWVTESGKLAWLTLIDALEPEAAAKAVKLVRLASAPLSNCARLTPAIVDNIAMVVLPNGEAVAVDLKTASVIWRSSVGERCLTPVGTDEGFVLSNSCLSVRTGKTVWKTEGARFVEGHVTVLGKRLIVTGLSDEGKAGKLTQTVGCFQMHTGKELWRFALAELNAWEDVSTPGAVVGAGRVLVGSADGIFHSIDLEDGRVRWKHATGPSLLKLSPTPGPSLGRITARAVLSERVIYFGAYDGVLYGFDVRRGKKLFSRQLGMPIVDDLLISGNTLLTSTCDGMVFWFVPTTTGK